MNQESPRLLALGGTSFVGRTIVEMALDRGYAVTVFNRGNVTDVDPRVEQIVGDREDTATLDPLRERRWDLVVDTWDGAPRATLASAEALRDRAARYLYISSEAVYGALPPAVDEDAPTVPSSPEAEATEFPFNKRGSEMAVTEVFGARSLILRPGVIVGPYENAGRLPWWLDRIAEGGEVLAPGPPDTPLQLVDARDLAAFALDAAQANLTGAFNTVSRSGDVTMQRLLDACVETTGSNAELTWVAPDAIAIAGIGPWVELPIWVPPLESLDEADSSEGGHPLAGVHTSNVERAHTAGLRCRPIEETVRDTWAWLSALDAPPPLLEGIPRAGYARERETAALAVWHEQHG